MKKVNTEIAIKVSSFAEREILPLTALSYQHEFPRNLWVAMGREGLLGLYGRKDQGGSQITERELVACGDLLVRRGGSLGMALSWLVHNLIAHQVIDRFGNEGQKQRWLPALLKGENTAAMAVSEPGMGGSPKRLSTTAEVMGDEYQLNGRKMYLTNGPIADLFIVFAVTGQENGRKRFGAFLVERNRPGLTVTEDGAVDFLLPSPHGGIELDNCQIPRENLLGEEGDAFNAISKPFRFVEDVMSMGPLLGGMKRQLDRVAPALKRGAHAPTSDVTAALGRLWLMVGAIEVLLGVALEEFDAALASGTPPNSLLSARILATRFQQGFTDFLDEAGMKGDSDLNILTRDMQKLTGLGRGIAEIHHRRLGIKALHMDD